MTTPVLVGSVDGLGEAEMVRLPGRHGVDVQQPADGQHVVGVQQVLASVQQAGPGQQIG